MAVCFFAAEFEEGFFGGDVTVHSYEEEEKTQVGEEG